MMRSLYSGISGLRNFQTKMDIIGNNIANVNTVAFKSGRITFGEALSQKLSGESAPNGDLGGINPMQVGLGMRTLGVDTNFSQGSMETTGVVTDLALQGNGFFVVSDGGKNFYTRAGSFQLDADGNLVAEGTGYKVLGRTALPDGSALDASSMSPLSIPLGRKSQAHSTTEVKLAGNLDMDLTTANASLLDAGNTGILNLSGVAMDGVGGNHQVVIAGQNATQSQGSGTVQGLQLNDTLGSHGVTATDGFQVVVDGSHTYQISGLDQNSTVSDLLNAINSAAIGCHAELDANGAIQITRSFHGDGASYNVVLQDTNGSNVATNLLNNGGTMTVNNGAASTLTAVDTFLPTGQNTPVVHNLTVSFDATTGLANGISDLGGGGVSINAPTGLAAGTANIHTDSTETTSSIYVYDSLGNTHNLTLKMSRSETPGMWRWTAEADAPATIAQGGSGTVSFKDDGSLSAFTYDQGVDQLVLNPKNGAQSVSLKFDAGKIGSFDGLTSSASSSSMMASGQNGYGMGELQGISVDSAGKISGSFSNGQVELLGQLLVANFNNPQGLTKSGQNLYEYLLNSGSPRIAGADESGSMINSGYLEMSNVDLSKEFTDMIEVQRAFQAAARVITTSDQLLQEVTAMKR